jgi:Arc/MetJ-type ribon-helix-helix transcriptional regulator
VVIAPLPEYESMSDVLRIARSRDEFFRLVEEALSESDPLAKEKRRAAVASGTWEARAEWVSNLIENVLNRHKEAQEEKRI